MVARSWVCSSSAVIPSSGPMWTNSPCSSLLWEGAGVAGAGARRPSNPLRNPIRVTGGALHAKELPIFYRFDKLHQGPAELHGPNPRRTIAQDPPGRRPGQDSSLPLDCASFGTRLQAFGRPVFAVSPRPSSPTWPWVTPGPASLLSRLPEPSGRGPPESREGWALLQPIGHRLPAIPICPP